MIKSKLQNISAALLLTVALAAPLSLNAQDTTSTTAAASATPKAAKKAKPTPYTGTIVSVDATGKTFTIGSTTYVVTDSTQWKGGKFEDLAAGTKVTGSFIKDGDKTDAYSVHIHKASTPKTKASATPKS